MQVTTNEIEQEVRPEEPGRGVRWCRRLGRVAPFLVVLALLLHPTQVTVKQVADLLAELAGRGSQVASLIPSVGICVSDVLFLVAFVMWAAWRAVDGRLRDQVQRYPKAIAALLIAAVLSAVPFLKSSALFTGRELDYARAAKELVQFILFFVCTFAVLADYLRDPTWRRRLVAAFLVAAIAGLAVGIWEYGRLQPSPSGVAQPGHTISPVDVDGTFGLEAVAAGAHEQIGTKSNRNVLGAWVSLILPLLWGIALWAPRPSVRGVCGVASWAGMLLLLTGGLWVVTLAAFLLISYLRGGRTFAWTAAGLFLFWALVFRFAPQNHGAILADSFMLRRTADRFHTLPVYGTEGTARSGAPEELSAEDHRAWQQRFVEWQPGLQAVVRDPLFGVGIGNYQNNINLFYEPKPDPVHNPGGIYNVPKPSANLMESGANSQYLVWGVEAGLAGLFALAWLLMFGLKSAVRTTLTADCGWWRGLALGCLGAVCAAVGGMLFTTYFVRGVGTAFVFVLALCATFGARPAAAEAEPSGQEGPEAEPAGEPGPTGEAEQPDDAAPPAPEVAALEESDGTAELMEALELDEGPELERASEPEPPEGAEREAEPEADDESDAEEETSRGGGGKGP